MCYEGKEHGSVTADNKGAWPRLRVRAGFCEEVMPEPRSGRRAGDGRGLALGPHQGQRREGAWAQGVACAMTPHEDAQHVPEEEEGRTGERSPRRRRWGGAGKPL